ncbi:hypothetical protein F5884DRAFT_291950 [Xylogone sp. PMI_703]|nr:hypothetical protein F5884DRAFT_291950 [Xylogone sp. PMI_703]
MAVMTSQHPQGIALKQKTQPVPSSDKMALDLDIHGTSYRDDTNHDSVSPDDAPLNTPLDMSSPQYTSSAPAVNGHANADATAANATLDVNSGAPNDAPVKGDYTASVENLRLSQSSDAASATNLENNTASDPLSAVGSTAVDAAFEDPGASTVPPVIEAPESDMRDAADSTEKADAERDPLDLSAEAEMLPDPEPASSDARANSQDPDLTPNSPSTVPTLPTSTIKTESTADASLPQANNTTVQDMEQKDAEMVDAPAPSSTSKIAREREDDDNEIEPLAKRTKTEDSEAPAAPKPSTNGMSAQNGDSTAATDSSPILPHQAKEISRVIRNVLKTTSGKNFRLPVAVLWPGFAEAYLERTPNPIDLSTIDRKVKGGEYATIKDFRDDVWLLYNNCLAFNGPEHAVTKTAEEVRDAIFSRTADLPPEPPAAAPKAAKKQPKRATPAAEPAASGPTSPRRAPRAPPAAAAPPAPKTETFALDPSTSTPLIRRDSTKNEGGRPKREIHPPKNKDLTYSVRPKSKKFATELRFCEEVLNEMKKAKYHVFSTPFLEPVDPVALGIPNYFKVIKTPMDISTVSQKLQNGHYAKAKDFESDIKLIFANCYKFNPPGNPVRGMGKSFEEVFDREWARKDKWISDHTPAAPSPPSMADTDEEESEEEEEHDPVTTATPTALRLIEEQNKLITLMTAKKPDQSLIQMQKDLIEVIQKRVVEETQAAPKKTKKGKPASSKPPKKGPGAKKGAAANSKKSGAQRQKYLGTLEKEVISAGLGSLSDDVSDVVLGLIKGDQPGVDVGDDGTLELDIDLVTTPTLWKIYDLIMRHAPEVEAMVRKQMQEKEAPRSLAKPPPKKKNKPMSKSEQERKIEHLKNSVQEFERHGSGSQEPVMPTVEHHPQQQHDSSSDDDSSDSEEE